MKIKKILISVLCIVGTILVMTMPMSALLAPYPAEAYADNDPPFMVQIYESSFALPYNDAPEFIKQVSYLTPTESPTDSLYNEIHLDQLPYNNSQTGITFGRYAYSFDCGNLTSPDNTVIMTLSNCYWSTSYPIWLYIIATDNGALGQLEIDYTISLQYKTHMGENVGRFIEGRAQASTSNNTSSTLCHNLASLLPLDPVYIMNLTITIESESFFNDEGRIGIARQEGQGFEAREGISNGLQTRFTNEAINYGKRAALDDFDGEINFLDGLVNGVVSVFNAEIFEGITIGNIFLVVLALTIVVTALKFFAGG